MATTLPTRPKPSSPRLMLGNRIGRGIVGGWVMTEGVGWSLNDASPYQIPATGLVNKSWLWGKGEDGYGVSIASTNDYIRMGTNQLPYSFSGPFSIFIRVRPAAAVGNYGLVGRWVSGVASTNSYLLYTGQDVGNNLATFRVCNGSVANVSVSGGGFGNGVTTNFTGTWDGANINLYQDAKFIGSSAMTTINTAGTQNLIAGRLSEGNGLYGLQGTIFAVYVWNRALSQAEVAELWSDPYTMFRPSRTIFKAGAAAGISGPLIGPRRLMDGGILASGRLVRR